jgi:hypothetical protein
MAEIEAAAAAASAARSLQVGALLSFIIPY